MEKKWIFLAGFLLIQILGGCKKDYGLMPKIDEESSAKTVTFKIKPFATHVKPLSRWMSVQPLATSNERWTEPLHGNVHPAPYEQLLYFWSFNQESLVPDIGIDTVHSNVNLQSNGSGNPVTFSNGYPYPPLFEGTGKLLGARGAKDILFTIPIPFVEELGTFAFDASSSNTGPKSFNVSYAFGSDTSFHYLAENEELDIVADKKTVYSYDLSFLNSSSITSNYLHIKIELLPGTNRPDGSNFNASTGVFKIDNVNLSGVFTGPITVPLNLGEAKFHYHVFKSSDSTLVYEGEKILDSSLTYPEISLKLNEGDYFVSFIANFSNEPLLMPSNIEKAGDYYAYHRLISDPTIIYGSLFDKLSVSNDMSLEVEMERYYSLVTFEFTDTKDLEKVDRIELYNLARPIFSPYSSSSSIDWPAPEEEKIILYPDFSTDHTIQFHQFLGKTVAPQSVKYKIIAYNENNDVLHTIEVSALITNNIQLTFIGKLLENYGNINSGFEIKWKDDWGVPIQINF